MSSETTYLEEDPIKVPGQRYAVVSFVAPYDTNQKADYIAQKIRGCFSTLDDAQMHADRLSKMDRSFDVYVVEMYNWVKIPPNPHEIEDQVHQEKWLNDHIKGYKEEQLKAKQHFEERKDEMLNNIKENNKSNTENKSELDDADPWMKNKRI